MMKYENKKKIMNKNNHENIIVVEILTEKISKRQI